MFRKKIGNQEHALESAIEMVAAGRVSINDVSGSDSILQVDSLIDLIETCEDNIDQLNQYEMKMLCTLTSSLANEAGASITEPLMTSVIQTCRVKLLSIVLRLLAMPEIAKKELDTCFQRGFAKCLQYDDEKIVSISLCCISRGFDEFDDDVERMSMCISMERQGYYESLSKIIMRTAERSGTQDACIRETYPFLCACEQLITALHISSLPSVTSSVGQDTYTLRGKILQVIQGCLPSLTRLITHHYRPVSYDAIVAIINLLNAQHKAACFDIQETCRFNGSLLTLLRLTVRTIMALSASSSSSSPSSSSSRQDSASEASVTDTDWMQVMFRLFYMFVHVCTCLYMYLIFLCMYTSP
jgi:hypothetical protein